MQIKCNIIEQVHSIIEQMSTRGMKEINCRKNGRHFHKNVERENVTNNRKGKREIGKQDRRKGNVCFILYPCQ